VRGGTAAGGSEPGVTAGGRHARAQAHAPRVPRTSLGGAPRRLYDRPMRAAITATGHHVPPDVYTNDHFATRLDTTDEWIRSRTGIVERRFAKDGATSDLAVAAARRCLEVRGIAPAAVDGIVVPTMTPD